ncbi:hypothetical protein C1645_737923 [Glomus cerebriforme]|uniref:HMG box domain-containing protein n=1 Tax=Glomus cerebriforme TaxID=658196 RepID=A0A397SZ91_9GLOM|nr:hypothetical protein C1645_737923 [Glomus cerebriforme]
MDDRARVQSLLSQYAPPRHHGNMNDQLEWTLTPQQIRPLIPPGVMDLLSTNIVDFRGSKRFHGKNAYHFACLLRAQSQGVTLPINANFSTRISTMVSNLWSNEPNNIKEVYIQIAGQADHIYQFHNAQFPQEIYIIDVIMTTYYRHNFDRLTFTRDARFREDG